MTKLLRLALLFCATALMASSCHTKNLTAYGLTSTGQILRFETKKPSDIKNKVSVNGLNSDQSVARIAYRPSSNTLYCITNDDFLCTVNPDTGLVSLIGSQPFTKTTSSTISLSDPVISFDPTRDELRVIDAQNNLLVQPNSATIDLSVSPSKVAFDKNDSNHDKTPQIAGIAYHNPDAGASTTTLYALDVTTESLLRVGDDNVGSGDGSANSGHLHTIGSINFGFTTTAGFCIDQKNDTGYAALQQSGAGAGLYTIDLNSGAASGLGTIGDGSQTLISVAIIPGN